MKGHRLKNAIVLIPVIFSIFFIPPISRADKDLEGAKKKEIVTIGKGVITNGNLANARKAAISEALLKAVEIFLTRELGSQGMIINFQRLVKEVIPVSREWIENFNILTEDQIEGQYHILIRVKINEKVVEKQFREIDLVLQKGPPVKVLFLVSQIEPKENKSVFWWKDPNSETEFSLTELALHRIFEEHGFQAINRFLPVPEDKYSPEMNLHDLKPEDIMKWGLLFSSGLVIYGKCKIIPGEEVSVELAAYDTKSAFMIGRDFKYEIINKNLSDADQISRIINRLISQIANRLTPEIIGAIERPEEKPGQITVIVKGLTNYKQFKAFKEILEKDIEGVKSVKQTRVSSQSIYLQVEYSGSEENFLSSISMKKNYPFEAIFFKTKNGGLLVQIK